MRSSIFVATLALAALCTVSCDQLDPADEVPIKAERGKPGKADGSTAPADWNCNSGYFDSDDGCDCGCGVLDPDCTDGSIEACDYEWCESDDVVTAQNWLCGDGDDPGGGDGSEPPTDWTCSDGFYGTDDGCDCGCGVVDPDCASSSASACDYQWCSHGSPASSANHQCGNAGGGGGSGSGGSSSGSECDSIYDCQAGYGCSFDYANGDAVRRCRYVGGYHGQCYDHVASNPSTASAWNCAATRCWGTVECGVDEICRTVNQGGVNHMECQDR